MNWLKSVVVVATLLMLLVCLGIATAGFDEVRGYLDAFAGDGSADPYSREIHQKLRQVAIVAGFAILGAAVVLWWNHDRLFARIGRASRFLRRSFTVTFSRWRALVRGNGWCLFWLTVVAVLLRLPYLNQPIRGDESTTYLRFAQYPWFVCVSIYEDPNNHVFHTLCIRLCTRLFGEELWALRLPAFLAGVLMVPATFLAARLQSGRSAGMIAGGIVAVSSFLIEYSTNARGYTIVCLCTSLALLAASMNYREISRRRGSGLHWPLLILVSATGLWTIPVMLYPLVIIWSWLLISGLQVGAVSGRLLLMRAWCVSGLVTAVTVALLYTPVLVVSGWGKLVSNAYVRPMQWGEFFGLLPGSFLDTFELLSRDWPMVVLVFLGFGIVVWLWRGFSGVGSQNYSPAAVVSAMICFGVVMLQRVVPPERVWMFLIPLLAVLSSTGLASLLTKMNSGTRKIAVWGLPLVFFLWPVWNQVRSNSILESVETGVCPDAEEIVLFLKDRFGSSSNSETTMLFVATAPTSGPVTFYARRHGLSMRHFAFPNEQSINHSIVLVTRVWAQSVREVLAGLGLEEIVDANSYQPYKTFPTVVLYRINHDSQALRQRETLATESFARYPFEAQKRK